MYNFHYNFKFILDKRGFNYTSFARHLLTAADFETDAPAVERTRRKINRIANNQIKANIEDIAVFARILNVLPGLLAFKPMINLGESMNKIIETCKQITEGGTIKDDAKSLEVCFTKTIYRKKQNAIAAIAIGKKRPYVLWIGDQKLWCSCDDYNYNRRPLNNESGNLMPCKHLRSLAIRAVIKSSCDA